MSDRKIRSVKDLAQTAIFLCFLIILPVFSLSFYLYSQTGLRLQDILEKSFSVSVGVFGGAATLTAAYIAILLFTDWREPHRVQKISAEQKEIISATRRMKRSLDSFFYLMTTKEPNYLVSSSECSFAIEYNKLVNIILDDIDDLAVLLDAYKFNFTHSKVDESNHLSEIDKAVNSLTAIYQILTNPDPLYNFGGSYPRLRSKIESNDLQNLSKDVLTTLPDNLSSFQSRLTQSLE